MMSKNPRRRLSLLTDRQIVETLEFFDNNLDTDDEADIGSDSDSDEDYDGDLDEEELSSLPKRLRKTITAETLENSQQNLDLNFDEPELSNHLIELDTPYKSFSYFLNDEILEHIAAQSNLYAKQKDINSRFSTNCLEIRKYFGILIYMSVFRYPNVRSYWGEHAFSGIQNTMTRERFEEIRRFLHFNDNSMFPPKTSDNYDKLFKVRPIINHFNQKFQSVPLPQHVCVDEQMCATKMKAPIYRINHISGGLSYLYCLIHMNIHIVSKFTVALKRTCYYHKVLIWELQPMSSYVFHKFSPTLEII